MKTIKFKSGGELEISNSVFESMSKKLSNNSIGVHENLQAIRNEDRTEIIAIVSLDDISRIV